MENNKKWPSSLVATIGFLGGVISIFTIVAVNSLLNFNNNPQLAFVTQQFLTTNPFNSVPNPKNPTNPTNPSYPTNPTNPSYPTNPKNPSNPVAPNPYNTVPNSVNPPNPVNPNLFAKWSFLFGMIMNNPNPSVSPSCIVEGSTVSSLQPGVIHFEAQPNPSNAKIRCGLIDKSTNLVVDLAPTDVVSYDFLNIPEGNYDVVCLVRNSVMLNSIMNSFNYCKDGIFNINSKGSNNSPSPSSLVDLELNGLFLDPTKGGTVIVPAGTPLKYMFKIRNNPLNATMASLSSQLRIYPQGLINLSGATQSGSMYVVNLGLLNPGDSTGLLLEGIADPAGNGSISVAAELCDYMTDIDSYPCNLVNLNPIEDDEVKL